MLAGSQSPHWICTSLRLTNMVSLSPDIATTTVRSLSHPTRVYPSWASKIVEVGYIRLRWERVGVRGYGVRNTPNPLTRFAARTDLSRWARGCLLYTSDAADDLLCVDL